MTRTVIVYGPPASGKTRNAAALARHFGCRQIIDDWDDSLPIERGALHLTNVTPFKVNTSCQVLTIEEALFLLELRGTGRNA
jgi:hypothetical protein